MSARSSTNRDETWSISPKATSAAPERRGEKNHRSGKIKENAYIYTPPGRRGLTVPTTGPAPRAPRAPRGANEVQSYAGSMSMAGQSIRQMIDLSWKDFDISASMHGGNVEPVDLGTFDLCDKERQELSESANMRWLFLNEQHRIKKPSKRNGGDFSLESGSLVEDPQFSEWLKNMDYLDTSVRFKWERFYFDIYEQYGFDVRQYMTDKSIVDDGITKTIKSLPAFKKYNETSFEQIFSKINRKLDLHPLANLDLKLGVKLHDSELKTHTWDEYAEMARCSFSDPYMDGSRRGIMRLPTVHEVRAHLWLISRKMEQSKSRGSGFPIGESGAIGVGCGGRGLLIPPQKIDRSMLTHGFPELGGSECWIPVYKDESLDPKKRDWIQVGNSAFLGWTYEEKEKRYPEWGDSNIESPKKRFYAVMNGLVVTERLPSRELYHPSNSNKIFVCADIKAANFTVLHLFDPEIVLNFECWEDLISKPGIVPERCQKPVLIDCKDVRVRCLGKLSHDKGKRIQSYILNLIYNEIVNDNNRTCSWPTNVFQYSLDELFLETTEDAWPSLMRNLTALITRRLPKLAPHIKLGVFRLAAFKKTSTAEYLRQHVKEYADSALERLGLKPAGAAAAAASPLSKFVFQVEASDLPDFDDVGAFVGAHDGGGEMFFDTGGWAFDHVAPFSPSEWGRGSSSGGGGSGAGSLMSSWDLPAPHPPLAPNVAEPPNMGGLTPYEYYTQQYPLPDMILNGPPSHMGKLMATSVKFLDDSEVAAWSHNASGLVEKSYRVLSDGADGGRCVWLEVTEYCFLKFFGDKDKIDIKAVPRHERFSVTANLVAKRETLEKLKLRGTRSFDVSDLSVGLSSVPSDIPSWDYVRNTLLAQAGGGGSGSGGGAVVSLQTLGGGGGGGVLQPDVQKQRQLIEWERMSDLLSTFDSVSLGANMSHLSDKLFYDVMRRGYRAVARTKTSYATGDRSPKNPREVISSALKLLQSEEAPQRAEGCRLILDVIQNTRRGDQPFLCHYAQRIGAFRLSAEFFRRSGAGLNKLRAAAVNLLLEMCFWNARSRHELREMNLVPTILEIARTHLKSLRSPLKLNGTILKVDLSFPTSCFWLLSVACIRNEPVVEQLVHQGGVTDVLAFTFDEYVDRTTFLPATRLLANICAFACGREAVCHDHKYDTKIESGTKRLIEILKTPALDPHVKDALLICLAKLCADSKTCRMVVDFGGIPLLLSFMTVEPHVFTHQELELFASKDKVRTFTRKEEKRATSPDGSVSSCQSSASGKSGDSSLSKIAYETIWDRWQPVESERTFLEWLHTYEDKKANFFPSLSNNPTVVKMKKPKQHKKAKNEKGGGESETGWGFDRDGYPIDGEWQEDEGKCENVGEEVGGGFPHDWEDRVGQLQEFFPDVNLETLTDVLENADWDVQNAALFLSDNTCVPLPTSPESSIGDTGSFVSAQSWGGLTNGSQSGKSPAQPSSQQSSHVVKPYKYHDSWNGVLDPSEYQDQPSSMAEKSPTPRSFLTPVPLPSSQKSSPQLASSPQNNGSQSQSPAKTGAGSYRSLALSGGSSEVGGRSSVHSEILRTSNRTPKAPPMHWATLALVQIAQNRCCLEILDSANVPGYLWATMLHDDTQERVCHVIERALAIFNRSPVSCDECGTLYDVEPTVVDSFRSGSRGYGIYADWRNLCFHCSIPPDGECDQCHCKMDKKFMKRRHLKLGRRQVGAHGSDHEWITGHFYFCSEPCQDTFEDVLKRNLLELRRQQRETQKKEKMSLQQFYRVN